MKALASQLPARRGRPPDGDSLAIASSAALVAIKETSPLPLSVEVLSRARELAEAQTAAPDDRASMLSAALAVRYGMTAVAAAAGWRSARLRVIAAGLDSGGFSESCTVLCAQILDSSDRVMRAHAEAFAELRWCSLDASCLAAIALLASADPDPAGLRARALRYAADLRQHGFAAGTPLLAASCLLARWHERRLGLLERFLECARRLDASQAWPFFTPAIAQLAISPLALDDLVPHVVAAERSHTIPAAWHLAESSRQVLSAMVARQDLSPAAATDEVAAALAALALTERDIHARGAATRTS
jgi:hypothetical protein